MGYADQKYFSYDMDWVGNIAFGTAAGATAATYTGTNIAPFRQTTQIAGAQLLFTTAANNKQTGVYVFLNGTNTLFTLALTTANGTAGSALYGTYNGTYTATGTATADKPGAVPANVFGTGTALGFIAISTATASGDATGAQELFVLSAQHV